MATNAEHQAAWRERRRHEVVALRNRNRELEAELASLRKPDIDTAAAIAELRERAATAETQVIALRRQLAAAQSRAAKPPREPRPATDNEEVAKLERQLKAAQTRIRNLTAEKRAAWEKARAENPTVLSTAEHNTLRKVFHPDAEAGVSEERKELLTRAAQIYNEFVKRGRLAVAGQT